MTNSKCSVSGDKLDKAHSPCPMGHPGVCLFGACGRCRPSTSKSSLLANSVQLKLRRAPGILVLRQLSLSVDSARETWQGEGFPGSSQQAQVRALLQHQALGERSSQQCPLLVASEPAHPLRQLLGKDLPLQIGGLTEGLLSPSGEPGLCHLQGLELSR